MWVMLFMVVLCYGYDVLSYVVWVYVMCGYAVLYDVMLMYGNRCYVIWWYAMLVT